MSDLYGDLMAEEFLGLTDKVMVHGYKLTQVRSSESIFDKQSVSEDLLLDNQLGELLYDVKTRYLPKDKMKLIGKAFGTRDARVYELTKDEGISRFLLVNDTRRQIKDMKVHLAAATIKDRNNGKV